MPALEAADDSSTVLRGKADVIVNGKFAPFGGRMLNSHDAGAKPSRSGSVAATM